MRAIIFILAFLGALVGSGKVKALDCPVPLNIWTRPADGDEISREQQRRDQEDRFSVYRLEQAPIIFRGRVFSARYLSDIRKTSVPFSVIIFDRVEVLKGRLFSRSKDRRAFVIKQQWCDHSCIGKLPKTPLPAGKIVVVAAHRNDFVDPSKAVDSDSNQAVYRGRIDAVLGMCSGGELSDRELELLNNPDEMARIKREFEVRDSN